MTRKGRSSAEEKSTGGNFAVLGMDIVAFSKLHDDDQTVVVRIGHDALRDLQKVPFVKQAWEALYGQRLGEIQEVEQTAVRE